MARCSNSATHHGRIRGIVLSGATEKAPMPFSRLQPYYFCQKHLGEIGLNRPQFYATTDDIPQGQICELESEFVSTEVVWRPKR